MRLKTYWHIIKNLLTSPKYYLETLKTSFGFSLRFFIMSMVLLGLTLSWRINQKTIPLLQHQVNTYLDNAATNYPPELEIIWEDNRLKSSTTEVMEIPYPESMEQNSQFPPAFGYFTPEDVSAEQFSEKLEKESLFVISSHKLFISDLQGAWADSPLTELFPQETIALNKNTSSILVSKVKQEVEKNIIAIKQLNFVLIPIGLIVLRLWTGFFEAILVFLFFKINKFNFSFKKVMQLSLHLVVVAEIINQITGWIYPNIQISMLILSYWSIFCYVFWTQKKHLLKLKMEITPQD